MGPARVVVMGVAASGKTAVGIELARLLAGRFVDADDLHPAANVEKMASGTPLTDIDRSPWLGAVGAELHGRAPVVVACSALKRVYRDRLRTAGPDPIRFVLLDAARSSLETRIRARTDHFMPASLLDDQLATLERPAADETDIVVVSAEPAVSVVVAAAAAALAIN